MTGYSALSEPVSWTGFLNIFKCMDKLIIIDSCMREESRTRVILDAAKDVLSARYDIETIDVNATGLPPVTPEMLKERTSGKVPEKTVALARKIA